MDIQQAQQELNKAVKNWYDNSRFVYSTPLEDKIAEAYLVFVMASDSLEDANKLLDSLEEG